MEKIKFLFVNLLIFVILSSGVSPALSQNETATPTPNQTTAAPTVTATTPATPAVTPVPTVAKFRVGPTVRLRPVTDVIKRNQDGIIEVYVDNPSLNDVKLTIEARISVPSGFHVYGQQFGMSGGAGTVTGIFEAPPGTGRVIPIAIKVDESARLGSHSLQFTATYWPGDNKDSYQVQSLTYSVNVMEASAEPKKPPEGAETPASKIPGFIGVLAIVSILAVARLLSRK